MKTRSAPGPGARAPRRGVTLIVALIMLSAIGLLAAWAFAGSSMNLRVVGNSQTRAEVAATAQTALEKVISTPDFMQQPAIVAGAAIPLDVDGDGRADQTARITPVPTCYRSRTVRLNELDPAVAADRVCLRSASASNLGIDSDTGSPNGDSLCADSEWNVRALVSDVQTGATVAMAQGIAARGLVTDAANGCP